MVLKGSMSPRENSLDTINVKLGYIKDVQDEMKQDIKDLKVQVTDGYVSIGEFKNMDKRVTKIEDSIRWVSYLIIGIVITAVVGLVVMQGK